MVIETYTLPESGRWAYVVWEDDALTVERDCDETGYATPEAALSAARAHFPAASAWLHTDGELRPLSST